MTTPDFSQRSIRSRTRSATFPSRPPVARGRARAGSGFFQQDVLLPERIARAVLGVLARYGEAERWLLIHLAACQAGESAGKEWVPIYSRLIERDIRRVDLNRLVGDGVIEIRAANRQAGRCREFRVAPGGALAEALRLTMPLVLLASSPPWSLAQNAKARPAGPSLVRDGWGQMYPRPLACALRVFNAGMPGRLHLPSAELHLRSQADAIERAGPDETRLRARLANDEHTLLRILACQKNVLHGETLAFRPRYTVVRTGRIVGGAQGFTREMKAAVYAPLGVTNYDLVASQATLLSASLDERGLPCPWLQTYVSDPKAKYRCAAAVGVTVDLWKQAFYALVFGSDLRCAPRYPAAQGWAYRTEIARMVYEQAADDNAAATVYARLQDELRPLAGAVSGLGQTLAQEYAAGSSRGRHPRNHVGLPIRPDWASAKEQQRRLLAHELQSREALFIHLLTGLSEEFGFQPVSNEHDGIVTLGAIPNEAIERVKALVGVPMLRLAVKPFA